MAGNVDSVVAIVDDDEGVRAALKNLMRANGLAVETFRSAEEFIESGILSAARCLILDVRLPGMSGLELQALLNASGSRVALIFITGHADEHARATALDAGAIAFLPKPVSAGVLGGHVRMALDDARSAAVR